MLSRLCSTGLASARAFAASESGWLQRTWYSTEDRDPNKVLSAEVCTGANIFTEGSDPPLQLDEEYPEWLWDLSKPLKTSKQLKQELDDLGGRYDDMPFKDFSRLMKKERRDAIKAHNLANKRR